MFYVNEMWQVLTAVNFRVQFFIGNIIGKIWKIHEGTLNVSQNVKNITNCLFFQHEYTTTLSLVPIKITNGFKSKAVIWLSVVFCNF